MTTQAATGCPPFVAGRNVMSWSWAIAAWVKAAQLDARCTVGVPTTSPWTDTFTSRFAGEVLPVQAGGGGSVVAVFATGRAS